MFNIRINKIQLYYDYYDASVILLTVELLFSDFGVPALEHAIFPIDIGLVPVHLNHDISFYLYH